MKIQNRSSDEIISQARDLYARFPQLTKDEKRRIVETITERITIGQEEVIINLNYLPAPSEMAAKEQWNNCGTSPTGCSPEN